MRNRHDNLWLRVYAAAILAIAVALLAGCGGGAKDSSNGARVQISIQWPEASRSAASRYIPPYASSLVFEIYLKSDPNQRYTLVANRPDSRPSTQTVSYQSLIPAGLYTLAGVARADLGGQGATVASAISDVTLTAGQTADVNLTFASTIGSLDIQGQPLRLNVGTQTPLTGRALDPDNKVILLPTGALKWSVVSGGTFGSITDAGVFTATAPGTVKVRLSEPGANISVDADVQVVAAGGGGLADSGWPKTAGDLANSGRVGSGAAAAGTLKWSVDNVGSFNPQQPAVAKDGKVYVSQSNRIIAVDPANGSVAWQSNDIGTLASGLTLGADGTIYGIISDQGGSSAVAVDRTTGDKRWTVLLDTDTSRAPVAGSNGLVYVQGGRANGQPGGKVYAIDETTGVVRWTNSFGGCYLYGVTIAPDGTLYTAGDDGWFYALDAATGALKWKHQTWVRYNVPAIGANGTVYVNVYRGSVRAFNPAAGTPLWTTSIGTGRIANSPVVLGPDGTVYSGTNNFPGQGTRVTALDGVTGAIKWSVVLDGVNAAGMAVAADGTLFVTLENTGKLVALNPADGSEKWTYQAGTTPSSPSIGPDGVVYFASYANTSGKLYAVK